MRNKLLLFPFSGNAREALIAIKAINAIQETWEVLGFVDDNEDVHGKEELGIKVLGGREVFNQYPDAKLLAVQGKADNYSQRKAVIDSLKFERDSYATVVHPSVTLAENASIGWNCLIMANVIVSSGVSIGNHCIILPNTTIAHDAKIGDYCCIGSNVVVSGNVNVSEQCYIGSGSSIRENLSLGSTSLLGLGSVVVKDVPSNVTVVGNPAKELQ